MKSIITKLPTLLKNLFHKQPKRSVMLAVGVPPVQPPRGLRLMKPWWHWRYDFVGSRRHARKMVMHGRAW